MSKKIVLLVCLVALVVVGGVMYRVSSVKAPLVPIPAVDQSIPKKNTVAYQWQWENFTDKKTAPPTPESAEDEEEENTAPRGEVPYDVVKIYSILQSVEIGDDGRVMPNHTAKVALDIGFDDLGLDLSPAAIAELQELIRIGLPGEAGEEAAMVLENYHQFLLAEEEFNHQTSEGMPVGDRYDELVQLRREYLGTEMADQLFQVEDVQARHMISSFAVHQNQDLNEDEKRAELDALQESFDEKMLALGQLEPEIAAEAKVQRLRDSGATDAEIYSARENILGVERAQELQAADREEVRWQNNFNGFWQARQQIVQAGLDDAEKERQIEQLLNQHFTPDERERARLTAFKWESKD